MLNTFQGSNFFIGFMDTSFFTDFQTIDDILFNLIFVAK